MTICSEGQGDSINWFSPHQRAILAGMSYVELQLLVRHCRQLIDAESQRVEDLKKLITELADALESIPIILHPPHLELLERAREAVK
jgi:hypothetical protein